jgi:predicted enzyme related to lactoylglutathione lyase
MDLTRVIIFTGDVERLVDFYRTCFGLKLVGRRDPGWTELRAGGCNLAFHRASVKTAGKTDTGIKFVFGAKDVRKVRARLMKRGVRMGEVMEFDGLRLCDGSDPDGNRFQLSSRGM